MTYTPANWKEARRLQAWHLKQKGWSQRHMAEAMGVSEAAVSQWMKRARVGGPGLSGVGLFENVGMKAMARQSSLKPTLGIQEPQSPTEARHVLPQQGR